MAQDIVYDFDFTEHELRMLARYGTTAKATPRVIEVPSSFSAPYVRRGLGGATGCITGTEVTSAIHDSYYCRVFPVGERPEGHALSRVARAVRSALSRVKWIRNFRGWLRW